VSLNYLYSSFDKLRMRVYLEISQKTNIMVSLVYPEPDEGNHI
jgi:hypothetical protein